MKLYIISGPSGCGKNTVYDAVAKRCPGVTQTVSATTRKPRDGEKEGVDYYFLSNDEFERLVAENEFVEYVRYGGNCYGTLKRELKRLDEMSMRIVLVIEVTGAENIKKQYPEAKSIFLMPPSLEELRRRLTERGQNTPEEAQRRMEIAEEEMKYSSEYDYCVVNGELEDCIRRVGEIIMTD